IPGRIAHGSQLPIRPRELDVPAGRMRHALGPGSAVGVLPAHVVLLDAGDMARRRVDLDGTVLGHVHECPVGPPLYRGNRSRLVLIEDSVGTVADKLDCPAVRTPRVDDLACANRTGAASGPWITCIEIRGAERQLVVEVADPVLAEESCAFPKVVVCALKAKRRLAACCKVELGFDLVARRQYNRVPHGFGCTQRARSIAAR